MKRLGPAIVADAETGQDALGVFDNERTVATNAVAAVALANDVAVECGGPVFSENHLSHGDSPVHKTRMSALMVAAILAALAGVAGCGNESPDGAVRTPGESPRVEAEGPIIPGETTPAADAATSASPKTTWAVVVSGT